MKLLLDTHAFIWWTSDSAKLSTTVAAALGDANNEIWLSVVSTWEMQIKLSAGKPKFFQPLPTLVAGQQSRNNLKLLPALFPHVLRLDGLPPFHRDPFDRLLIAQALEEGATLISCDAAISQYSVPILW